MIDKTPQQLQADALNEGVSLMVQQLRRQHQRIDALEKALQATYDALQTSYPLHSCDMDKRFVVMSQARALLSTTQQEDSQA